MKKFFKIRSLILALSLSVPLLAQAAEIKLLNVSYDPTRELYQDFNAAFSKYWLAKTGDTVTIKTSHGGSGNKRVQLLMAWMLMSQPWHWLTMLINFRKKPNLFLKIGKNVWRTTARPIHRQLFCWCGKVTRKILRIGMI